MANLLALEWAYSYGIELCEAVRPTEEQLSHFSDEYKSLMYFGVYDAPHIKLEHITQEDLPKRKADGCFPGCSNQIYLINREEWDAYIALNDKRNAEKQQKEREDRIAYIKRQLLACEHQCKLYTREEVERMSQSWINVVNEGGDGYVPSYHTQEEYDRLTAELAKIEQEEHHK